MPPEKRGQHLKLHRTEAGDSAPQTPHGNTEDPVVVVVVTPALSPSAVNRIHTVAAVLAKEAIRLQSEGALPSTTPFDLAALEAALVTAFHEVDEVTWWENPVFDNGSRMDVERHLSFPSFLFPRVAAVDPTLTHPSFFSDAMRAAANSLPTTFRAENKTPLSLGTLGDHLGALTDREEARRQVVDGLLFLAGKCGTRVDKKDAPLICVSAGSGHGKTAFLAYITNHFCTFARGCPGANLLRDINACRVSKAPPLTALVTLSASFNQGSTVDTHELPILEQTTMERLLRSFHGKTDFKLSDTRYGCKSFGDLRNYFDADVGIIICLDELAMVRNKDRQVFKSFLDTAMAECQRTIASGGFLAIIGTTLSVFDVGRELILDSGRSLWSVRLPRTAPEMKARAEKHLRLNTKILSDGAMPDTESRLQVALNMLSAGLTMDRWQPVFALDKTALEYRPVIEKYRLSKISSDQVFTVVAHTVFRNSYPVLLDDDFGPNEVLCREIVNHLHGNGRVVGENMVGLQQPVKQDPVVRLELDAWRLLQLGASRGDSDPEFKQVQPWVIRTLQKIFYLASPSDIVKAWEIGTMALLELHKALLQEAFSEPPTLRRLLDGLDVKQHTVADVILDRRLDARPCSKKDVSELLRYAGASGSDAPCLDASTNPTEVGVEGVLRNWFGPGTAVFYQMEMHSKTNPGDIEEWLKAEVDRATALGYPCGTFVVMLFVTGTSSTPRSKLKCPPNSVVFSDPALLKLFEPFGPGVIAQTLGEQSARFA